VNDRAKKLDAVKSGNDFQSIFNTLSAEHKSNNNYYQVSYCTRTYKNYIKQLKLAEYLAQIKSSARIEAYNNLRNPLSFIAMLNFLFNRVSRELFLSVDATSVLLYNDKDSIKVITHAEARTQLKAYNTGISTSGEAPQQRVVTFTCAISGDNQLVCSVVMFADRLFSGFNKKPHIFKLEPGLYVCLYKYGMNETVLNLHVLDTIAKEAIALRARLIEHNITGMQQVIMTSQSQPIFTTSQDETTNTSSSQQQQSDPSPPHVPFVMPQVHLTDAEIREQYRCIAIAADGAFGQVNAINTQLYDKVIKNGLDIFYAKYAAGCSMIQQANDTGQMHRVLKLLFHSKKFRYDPVANPPHTSWQQLKVILEGTISGASFKTLWRCLSHVKAFLNKAFSELNIMHAFADTGIIPFQPKVILSACPPFKELSQPVADQVMSCMEELNAIMEERGIISEKEFERVLSVAPGADTHEEKGKGKDNMSMQRQRALIISHPEVHASEVVKQVREAERKAWLSQQAQDALNDAADNADILDAEHMAENAEGGSGTQQGGGTSSGSTTVPKKQATSKCSNPLCSIRHPTLKVWWNTCTSFNKTCKMKFCKKPECAEVMNAHVVHCNQKRSV
jgi:hypothetical protein